MKYILVAFLAAISFGVKTAGAADAIALTVWYNVLPGSGPQVEALRLGQKEIFDIARTALEAKGWKVVRSPKAALGGAEVKLDINVVQNAGGGGNVGFAVALGMYGVSNGTSKVSNTKRVAFNYSSALVSYGGSYDFAVENTRKDVASQITQWISSSF